MLLLCYIINYSTENYWEYMGIVYAPHLLHITIYTMFEKNAKIAICNNTDMQQSISTYIYIYTYKTTIVDQN